MKSTYVQYGCGLSSPQEWINFDISPTLRIRKIPLIGALLKSRLNVAFPSNAKYGDIIKGLPVNDNSCDGLYCSHTLEHLSLNDFRTALKNSYKILKKGGVFRCVVPDLAVCARNYIEELEKGNATASIDFVGTDTILGTAKRPQGAKGLVSSLFGNSRHLWMWDETSLVEELKKAEFKDIRICKYHDCEDEHFKLVETEDRFKNAVAIECRK